MNHSVQLGSRLFSSNGSLYWGTSSYLGGLLYSGDTVYRPFCSIRFQPSLSLAAFIFRSRMGSIDIDALMVDLPDDGEPACFVCFGAGLVPQDEASFWLGACAPRMVRSV